MWPCHGEVANRMTTTTPFGALASERAIPCALGCSLNALQTSSLKIIGRHKAQRWESERKGIEWYPTSYFKEVVFWQFSVLHI